MKATVWRILVIEDNLEEAQGVKDGLEGTAWLPNGDSCELDVKTSFGEGLKALERTVFDILVLDLRTDVTPKGQDEAAPGLEVLKKIQSLRFVPVIFYTALPKHVEDLKSAFVRVVEKTDGIRVLRREVAALLETKLPALNRYLQEQQREYMWDFVAKSWRSLDSQDQKADLAFLLARRLAAALREQFARTAAAEMAGDAGKPVPERVHPAEYYILPPVGDALLAGDLVTGTAEAEDLWVVLTPTCDLVQKKADHILLARCVPLKTCGEYTKWIPDDCAGPVTALRELLRDNRQGQRERYKFLPGSIAFSDSVVDLQDLRALPIAEEPNLTRVASLDSPFAEKLLSMFARFYGRIGTPDLDVDLTLARLKRGLPTPAATGAPSIGDGKPAET